MSARVKTPSPTDPLDLASDEARIGVAWRELRRGAAMQAMRDKLYGDLLDPGQVDALDVVMQYGGCRMAQLADGLRVDPSSATRVVDRLVVGGLLERVAADGDGRGVRVVPTPAGRQIHEKLAMRRRSMLFSVLEGLGADDRRQLATLLERLVDGVDRYVGAAESPV